MAKNLPLDRIKTKFVSLCGRVFGQALSTARRGGYVVKGGTGGKAAWISKGFSGSPLKWYVGVPVGISVLVHLLGRTAYRQGRVELYTADAVTLVAITLMLSCAALIMHHVYRMAFITYATLAAALCLLVGQAFNVVDHSPLWGLQESGNSFDNAHIFFKDGCFVIGIALLFGVYFMSLLESNRARASIAGAYDDIERKVNERTTSLVEANQKLGQEIRVRRDAEEALRLSEEKFRALVENSADLILRLDTQLCILYANPTALDAMEKTGAGVTGRHVERLLGSGPAAEEWCGAAGRVIDSGKPGRVETRSGGGRALQLLDWSLAAESDADGQVTSLLTVARDMTQLWRKEAERRTLEEQLVQSQKLESVGRLAGGVAHDFNNLLQVISGYLEIAMGEIESEHRAQGRLKQVDKAARRATSLVRQLLAFSRRETMRCEHIDLNRLVLDMAKMFQRVMGEQYEINIAAALGLPLIFADAGHVEQVLMNLCVNARDAMPGGGAIRIAMRCVHVSEDDAETHADRKKGDYVEIIVSDSGIGMAADVLPSIFEPFFTTKETGKGTGLGLAVVYGIVRQHGGFLSVESRPGVGSSFSIFLPAAPEGAVESAAEAETPTPPDGFGETILLAEDDEQVRDLAIGILERAGYRVIEAADGLEAIAIVEERCEEIDLFMLDAIMPRKTGREVFEAIVAQRPEARILFVTGHSFNTLAEINLPERGYELLHKPISTKELLTKVRIMLDDAPPL